MFVKYTNQNVSLKSCTIYSLWVVARVGCMYMQRSLQSSCAPSIQEKELMSKYKERFDIVLTGDPDLSTPLCVLKTILE